MPGFWGFVRGRFGFAPMGEDKQALTIWLFNRRRRRDPSLRGVEKAAFLQMFKLRAMPEAILVDIVDAYVQLRACSISESETLLRIDKFRSEHLGPSDASSATELSSYIRLRVEREQSIFPISKDMFPWFIDDSLPRCVKFLKSHPVARIIDDRGNASSLASLPKECLIRQVLNMAEEIKGGDVPRARALARLLCFSSVGDEIWEFTHNPGQTGYVRDGYALIRADEIAKAVIYNQVHYLY